MNIIVLNSGSNGNAVYVESRASGASVLLDCGISRKRIQDRLQVHGRFLENLSAAFITHEHADHARGVSVVTKLFHTPVYLTEGTYRGMQRFGKFKGFRLIENSETVQIEDITVQAFSKPHDAADPVFFLVTIAGKRFLYATDLGESNAEVERLLPEVDALLLESNYDYDMLVGGDYPPFLQERIHGSEGHLSNSQAMQLIEKHCNGSLKLLILGHLSENNNTPEIVQREIGDVLRRKTEFSPRVHVASRYDVGEVLEL